MSSRMSYQVASRGTACRSSTAAPTGTGAGDMTTRGLRRSTSAAAVVGPGWCGAAAAWLLDAHDHRVGPRKRFGVGVAEADVGHPGAAVGGGVVEARLGFDQHVQAHEKA